MAAVSISGKANGFEWIAFCTGKDFNKPIRARKNPRACIYLFEPNSFTGISLTGKIEVVCDTALNDSLWYDALGSFFKGPDDEKLCALIFRPKRYNIFIEGRTIRGSF